MKNNYVVKGEIVKIFFRKKDGFFIIDKEDLEKVSQFTWCLTGSGYVESNKNYKHIKCHHVIIGKPPEGLVTDHINRNPLDNRKSNLRHVTPHVNSMNRSVCHRKMMGIRIYKGKRRTTYYVDLHEKDGKTIHIGKFKTLEEALSKRDEAYERIWKR